MKSRKETFSCLNDFKILRQIGKGAHGTVFKAIRRADGLVYAIKTINIGRVY